MVCTIYGVNSLLVVVITPCLTSTFTQYMLHMVAIEINIHIIYSNNYEYNNEKKYLFFNVK